MFVDMASGKDTRRPQLEALLDFVREGDVVAVHSLDRLVQGLVQRGVRVEFVKEGLHFTGEDSPMAQLLLSVMGESSPNSNAP